MANGRSKKITTPIKVTVVFPDREVTYDGVFTLTKNEDRSLLLQRYQNEVNINNNYLYYEIDFGG